MLSEFGQLLIIIGLSIFQDDDIEYIHFSRVI